MTSPLIDYFVLAENAGGELRIDPKDVPVGATRAFCLRLRLQINAARYNLRKETRKLYSLGHPSYGVTPWDSYTISLRQDKSGAYYLLISSTLKFHGVTLSNPTTGEVINTEMLYDPQVSGDGNTLQQDTPDASDLL